MSNLPKNAVDESPRKKKKGCLKIAILTVIVLAVVINLTISGIAKSIANKQLPSLLETDANIGGLDISLLLGRLGLRRFTIEQPEGFEGDSLMKLDKLVVVVPPHQAIKGNPVEIRNVHLDGLDVNLIVDTNVVLNVTTLGPAPTEEPVEEVLEEETIVADVVPLWIKNLLLENVNLHFKDLERNGWEFNIEDLRLEMENIQVEYDSGRGPGRIHGDLLLPGGYKTGKMKLRAKVGTISPSKPKQTPALRLAIGLIGFDLDLVKPFLVPSPTVAKTAFGGSAFDFTLFVRIDAGEDPTTQAVTGKFNIATDSGTKINGKLGGTLAKPDLPFVQLFANILGNHFGRITRLGGNVAKGGLEAGKAVAGTGVAAVKGVGKTATGLVGGVFRTAKGVVTLDKDEALGGLKDSTVGTASNLTETVTDTAGAAADGVGKTAGEISGSTRSKKWWDNIDQRMLAFETNADQWFDTHPFPGTQD